MMTEAEVQRLCDDVCAIAHARWHTALDDLAGELPGPIRDHIEQHDAAVRAAAVAPVLALCAEWDRLSKGETPTTRRIRAAIDPAGAPRA
jgi:hypothetical protein